MTSVFQRFLNAMQYTVAGYNITFIKFYIFSVRSPSYPYAAVAPWHTRILLQCNSSNTTIQHCLCGDDEEYKVLNFMVSAKEGKNLDCQFSFSVEYDDIAGTKYSQSIYFDAFAGFKEFRTYDPKIIKEFDLIE